MTTVEIIRNVFRSGFDLRELAWTAWVEPGRAGVEHYTLWAPDGDVEDSVGLLLRFPPGAHGDFHEHLGYELMLVLDGTLEHSDGETFELEDPATMHMVLPVAGRGEIAPGRPSDLPLPAV